MSCFRDPHAPRSVRVAPHLDAGANHRRDRITRSAVAGPRLGALVEAHNVTTGRRRQSSHARRPRQPRETMPRTNARRSTPSQTTPAQNSAIATAVRICAKLEARDPELAREFIRRYQGATGFRTDVATTVAPPAGDVATAKPVRPRRPLPNKVAQAVRDLQRRDPQLAKRAVDVLVVGLAGDAVDRPVARRRLLRNTAAADVRRGLELLRRVRELNPTAAARAVREARDLFAELGLEVPR